MPAPAPALSPADQVHTAADRDAKDGTLVEVFGTYLLVDAHEPGTASGHAAVVLDDGTAIRLGPSWHPDAVRPDQERELAGRAVVAKGLLFAECPPPPDGRAYVKSACLHGGIEVLDRSTHDFLNGSD